MRLHTAARTAREFWPRLSCGGARALGSHFGLLTMPSRLACCSPQLREKREELNRSIAADEEEKGAPSPSAHR